MATLSAIKLILSHGLGNQKGGGQDDVMSSTQMNGFEKVFMNMQYLISPKFNEQALINSRQNGTDPFKCSLIIIKTLVEKVHHPLILSDENLIHLLRTVVDLKVSKAQYQAWTACVGAFMKRLGGRKFFQIVPLQIVQHDLNSLRYAQDSKSWTLTLIA
tara:strand:+ start:700 stop:1176 length:477 start_codon:yes stop_codon:yes gene_type:complete